MYRLIDIDVEASLPHLELTAEETGYALVLRRRGRPVGFIMQARSTGGESRIAAAGLAALIAEKAGWAILEEALREQLAPPRPPPAVWPSVSVAICTRDHPAILERCLTTLQALILPAGVALALEIIVIDNAPSDEQTWMVAARHPGVRYTVEPKPGLDFARNRALAEVRGELLAFIDDDAAVDPGWLLGLLTAWRENPDAGGFTGLVLPFELRTRAQILFERRGGFRRGFTKIRYGRDRLANPLYPCGAGIFGAGCNMAFRTDLLRRLGGFDEALDTGPPLPGGGDLDIFYRVIRSGEPIIYEPQMLVFHEHRRELRQLQRQYWTWGLGFMAFVAKSYRSDPELRARHRGMIVWWFRTQLRHLARSLRRRHSLPPRFLLAELAGGVAGLFGEYRRSERRVRRIIREHA